MYVKNFDPSWDEEKLKEVFGKYGKISTVFVKSDPENAERKFAFVCFFDANDKDEGFRAAEKAVEELNDKDNA